MHQTNTAHLLVVDDDVRLRQLLDRYLSEAGFTISTAQNAQEARILLDTLQFDMLVLDVMMPGETGLELTQSLRQQNQHLPILLLTAMGEVENRIQGLQLGADEYLSKPFEPQELLLRIQAILRRVNTPPKLQDGEVQIGHFIYDQKKARLQNKDKVTSLTTTEATMLNLFVAHMGTPLSRDMIATHCNMPATPRAIDVQITRLRRKLQDDPRLPNYIQTVRNVGYVLIAKP